MLWWPVPWLFAVWKSLSSTTTLLWKIALVLALKLTCSLPVSKHKNIAVPMLLDDSERHDMVWDVSDSDEREKNGVNLTKHVNTIRNSPQPSVIPRLNFPHRLTSPSEDGDTPKVKVCACVCVWVQGQSQRWWGASCRPQCRWPVMATSSPQQ